MAACLQQSSIVLRLGVTSAILGETLLAIERKALKACLGVKQSTPNNILYVELNRADIIAIIRHRQYSFYQRFLELDEEESVAKQI